MTELGLGASITLRSSPVWNGRCWLRFCDRAVRRGVVAILTGLEWPVLGQRFEVGLCLGLVAILTGLEWPVLVRCLNHDELLGYRVAILTGLEWPVLAP